MSRTVKIKKSVAALIIKKMQKMKTLFDIPNKREILTWPAEYKKEVLAWLELLEKFIASSFRNPEELPEPPALLSWKPFTAPPVVEGLAGALKLIDLEPPSVEVVAAWPPYKRTLAVLWFASFAALVGSADAELKSQVTEAWIPKYIRQDLPGATFQDSSQ